MIDRHTGWLVLSEIVALLGVTTGPRPLGSGRVQICTTTREITAPPLLSDRLTQAYNKRLFTFTQKGNLTSAAPNGKIKASVWGDI